MNLDQELQQRKLGESAGLLALHDAADNRLVSAHMLEQARRELCLLTRDLDKPVYDQPPFIAGLKALSLRSRRSRIRILLQDNETVRKHGHRILELARRLTSSIEIRRPGADWLDEPENFLLVDGYGYLHRNLSTSYEASADYHAPLVVERLRNTFDQIWEASEPDSTLRRLYI